MELIIPYKWTAIDLTTKSNGDLQFTLPNNPELQEHLVNQLMDWVSYRDFIEAIGLEDFEQMIEFYNMTFKNEE